MAGEWSTLAVTEIPLTRNDHAGSQLASLGVQPKPSLLHPPESAPRKEEVERMAHTEQTKPHEHEHEEKSKARQPHAPHEEHSAASKGPHDPKEINPKLASDIAYWAAEFKVSGEKLHEAIRTHGTHVDKIRAALTHHG